MNKKKIYKIILVAICVIGVLLVIHLTANNLIPYVKELHSNGVTY